MNISESFVSRWAKQISDAIRPWTAPHLILEDYLREHGGGKPVFFPDAREALALIQLPAKEFVRRIPQDKFENIMISGAAYDSLLLRDRKKAGEFLEILQISTGGDEKMKSYVVALTVAFHMKQNNAPFEDQEDFLAFCRGYGIQNLTKKRIEKAMSELQ